MSETGWNACFEQFRLIFFTFFWEKNVFSISINWHRPLYFTIFWDYWILKCIVIMDVSSLPRLCPGNSFYQVKIHKFDHFCPFGRLFKLIWQTKWCNYSLNTYCDSLTLKWDIVLGSVSINANAKDVFFSINLKK